MRTFFRRLFCFHLRWNRLGGELYECERCGHLRYYPNRPPINYIGK